MQEIHTLEAGEGASVSRRKFMAFAAAGSAATLPAVALAGASDKTSRLPQSPGENEHPWVKARRLADELAIALSEVDGAGWFATVYPRSEFCEWPIMFGSIQAERDARHRVESWLADLIEAHEASLSDFTQCCDQTDSVLLGREPSKAALKRYRKALRSEKAAFNNVVAYVPMNDASRFAKAQYLLKFTSHSQLNEDQVDALLMSMCGRYAV